MTGQLYKRTKNELSYTGTKGTSNSILDALTVIFGEVKETHFIDGEWD
jgi:hypothetical protein